MSLAQVGCGRVGWKAPPAAGRRTADAASRAGSPRPAPPANGGSAPSGASQAPPAAVPSVGDAETLADTLLGFASAVAGEAAPAAADSAAADGVGRVKAALRRLTSALLGVSVSAGQPPPLALVEDILSVVSAQTLAVAPKDAELHILLCEAIAAALPRLRGGGGSGQEEEQEQAAEAAAAAAVEALARFRRSKPQVEAAACAALRAAFARRRSPAPPPSSAAAVRELASLLSHRTRSAVLVDSFDLSSAAALALWELHSATFPGSAGAAGAAPEAVAAAGAALARTIERSAPQRVIADAAEGAEALMTVLPVVRPGGGAAAEGGAVAAGRVPEGLEGKLRDLVTWLRGMLAAWPNAGGGGCCEVPAYYAVAAPGGAGTSSAAACAPQLDCGGLAAAVACFDPALGAAAGAEDAAASAAAGGLNPTAAPGGAGGGRRLA